VDLSKTEIVAPFAGKIGLRNVSEGALVSSSMILASLQDVSKIKVDFSVSERYANAPSRFGNFILTRLFQLKNTRLY